jgi:hypothetical protein
VKIANFTFSRRWAKIANFSFMGYNFGLVGLHIRLTFATFSVAYVVGDPLDCRRAFAKEF